MQALTSARWGVLTLLLLACLRGASGQVDGKVPPEPFWHFALRTADLATVLIIFPADWKTPNGEGPFNTSAFVVERSDDEAFTNPVIVSNSYKPAGLAWLAVDASWDGDARPYYRVIVTNTSTSTREVSPVRQPTDQEGNLYVVANANVTEGVPCGDLLTAPCADIKSALAAAPAGSTIYVVPGFYIGPNNTDLSFGGKALTLKSTNGRAVTLINCTSEDGSKTRAFSFTGGEGRDSVIDGFTIGGGAADLGGCVSITNGAPTIKESMFFGCNATTGAATGGAIYSKGNPAPGPLIANTSFIFNFAADGAAIWVGGGGDARIEVDGCFFQWGICPVGTGRGGAVSVLYASLDMRNTEVHNSIVGFGGGGVMVESGDALLHNVTFYNNTAGNFGGAIQLFGANMTITNSNITGNRGSIFAGGVILTASSYNAFDTIHNDNWGRVGGGALKVVGGSARLTRCQLNGNTAGYGGAFDIAKQGDLSTMFTELVVVDSEVRNNAVPREGAGFVLDSFDAATFVNVTFGNNTATKGGAGFCNAPPSTTPGSSPSLYSNVTFEENVAQVGGAYFGDAPCLAIMQGVVFRRNSAVDAGAGVALGDGATLEMSNSLFEANGVSECHSRDPPMAGGGLMIGVEQFKVDQQCGAVEVLNPARVTISDTTFLGNVASAMGGGVHLEAGVLRMERVELDGNSAVGGASDAGDGLGGGVSINERCQEADSGVVACSTAVASLTDCALRGNSARSAGGGLHFAGNSTGGALLLTGSTIEGNRVEFATQGDNPADGVGGGVFLGRGNFQLADLQLPGNQAYYGGALFVAADLGGPSAVLRRLNASTSRAVVGPAAFWLRSASPGRALDARAVSAGPGAGPGAIATEVLTAAYQQAPPSVIQSGEDVPAFSVALLDYYGQVGRSELGSCVVNPLAAGGAAAPAADGNATAVNIRPLGALSGVAEGTAVFSQLQVSGAIGASYELQVDCTPNTLGRSRFLRLRGAPLPALPLGVTISQCAPGRQPTQTSTGTLCVSCPFGSFNLDGGACQICPRGAVCAGGASIDALPNWWRSSYNSTEFFSCLQPGACEGGPVAGDDACASGAEGPLCAVCLPGHFQFSGQCQACDAGGQAKIMLGVSIVLIVGVVGVLFARGLEFGDPTQPGVMTKVKILLAHFQVLALFRDYDVIWPAPTSKGLSWFDTFNVGLSMMAPECSVGHTYSFYWKWVFQMLLPIGAVALCVGVYHAAGRELRRRRAAAAAAATAAATVLADGAGEGPSGPATPSDRHSKVSEWLAGVQQRCWKNAFWLLTLLYPRASSTALQLFAVQRLDTGTYLAADFSILVRPPDGALSALYVRYMVPGALMLFVFAVVVPATFFTAIYRNRRRLDERAVAQRYGFLYGSYTRSRPYWETAESTRKFMFAFVPVFIKPNANGSVQGTVGQIVACAYLVATVWLRPYANSEDNDLTIASFAVLWLVLLSGCTAKWADLAPSGMAALAALQLLLSSGVAFTVAATIGHSLVLMVRRRKRAKKLDSNLGEGPVTEGAEAEDPGKRPGAAAAGGSTTQVNIRVEARDSSGSSGFGGGDDTPRLRRPLLGSLFARFQRMSSGQAPPTPGGGAGGDDASGSGRRQSDSPA